MTKEDLRIIQEFIGKGRLQEALKELSKHAGSSIELNNVYLQASRQLAELEHQKQKGVINYSEYSISRNKIAESIISLSSNVYEFHNNPVSRSKRRFIQILANVSFVFIALAVVGLLGFISFNFPVFLNEIDMILEEQRQGRKEKERQKEELISRKRREDSIDLATQRLIDSIKFKQFPEITIEDKRFEGVDERGFKAEYIIYLIRGFNWRLGEIALGEEEGIEFEICDYLGTSGIKSRINNDSLKAIICFGNTSFEEDLQIPPDSRLREEEDRAEKRAAKLAKCVNNYMENLTPIFALNLGKHTQETDFSEWQRQIIIVGLIKKDLETVEEEALYNGLVREYISENIEFNVMEYSKVDNVSGKLDMKKIYN